MTLKPMLCSTYDVSKLKQSDTWYISEKLDGWRMVFQDGKFYSRTGNEITPPSHIRKFAMNHIEKGVTLDGELWFGYDGFQEIAEAMDSDNQKMQWVLFDIPSVDAPFAERYEKLVNMFKDATSDAVRVLPQYPITNNDADSAYDTFMENNPKAEGVVYRPTNMRYAWDSRDVAFMKRKPFHDMEATVIGYYNTPLAVKKYGQSTTYVSSLICQTIMIDTKFRVSVKTYTPPTIGSLITVKYQSLTKDGVPRFPSYKGVRHMNDKPEIAQTPKKHEIFAPMPVVELVQKRDPLKLGERVFIESSKRGVYYCVAQPKSQTAKPYCTCPAWKYQRVSPKDRVCKHTACFL